jgi:uncharacterized protein (UPF0261 family)
MRTTAAENRAFARWIAAKLNQAETPFTLLLPEGGISALDAPGRPFHDPVADEALFGELERAITPSAGRKLVRCPEHINDVTFARRLATVFLDMARAKAVGPAQ